MHTKTIRLFLPKIWNPADDSKEAHLDPSKTGFIQIVCDKPAARENNNKREAGFESESVYLAKNKKWNFN
ncbi:MAG: hypothetical protein M1480_18730 [Bacteroidetes bacterium]|nr:hypothetical protein [Bacteroidota bacterium]